MKFCPECGSQLPLGPAKFCPNCGKSLWNVTESSNTLEEQKEATVQSGQNTIYSLGVKLEQMVEQIMKNKGFSTERRIKLRGQSGIFHEIDVLAKRENDVLAVECKNYGKARLVGIKEITDFQSKLQDLSQINHAMFVVVVETVFITDFSFSPAFANQIESKVVAYQKYLTEQNNLLAIRVIANQTVVQAQATARSNVARANGESEAIKIITSQLKQSPEYLQWLSINRWSGQMPYALGSGALPFFQLPKATTQQNQSNSSSTFAGGH